MSKELKPCPFCGTINELEECRFLDMIGMVYSIECKKCNDTRVMSLVSMDAAKIKWNTRPAEDALKSVIAEIAATIAMSADLPEDDIFTMCKNAIGEKAILDRYNEKLRERKCDE